MSCFFIHIKNSIKDVFIFFSCHFQALRCTDILYSYYDRYFFIRWLVHYFIVKSTVCELTFTTCLNFFIHIMNYSIIMLNFYRNDCKSHLLILSSMQEDTCCFICKAFQFVYDNRYALFIFHI